MARTGIMLCYPFEEKRLDKWTKPFLIQPKLDGDRCRAIFDEFGKVILLSSEGNIINSVPHINEQLENMGLKSIELDGELYLHGVNHQLIHGTVSRTVNIHPEFENIEYHIFDLVDEMEIQAERTCKVADIINESKNVKLVNTTVGYNIDDVTKALEEYSEEGYEGVIVRNVTYPYMRKRSTGIMKFKPRKSDYYTIVGFEEEVSIKGEPKNSLGALILKSDTDQIFNVGSGSFLTREKRDYLWKQKETLKGKIAHVKYQHLTDRRVPRFPVLVDIIGVL